MEDQLKNGTANRFRALRCANKIRSAMMIAECLARRRPEVALKNRDVIEDVVLYLVPIFFEVVADEEKLTPEETVARVIRYLQHDLLELDELLNERLN